MRVCANRSRPPSPSKSATPSSCGLFRPGQPDRISLLLASFSWPLVPTSNREVQLARLHIAKLREEKTAQENRLKKLRSEMEAQRQLLARQRLSLSTNLPPPPTLLLTPPQYPPFPIGEALAESKEKLHNSKAELESVHAFHSEQREMALERRDLLLTRQVRMLLELHSIYPIQQLGKDLCSICDLELPNSEYTGFDDENIATALGHVAHLVSLIAKYFDIMLRYPINYLCSRSTIKVRMRWGGGGGGDEETCFLF